MERVDDVIFNRTVYLNASSYFETRVGALPTEIRSDILRTSTDVIDTQLDQINDPNINHTILTKENIDLTFLKALNILDGTRNVPVPVGSISVDEPVADPFALLPQSELADDAIEFDMQVYANEPVVPLARAEPRKRVHPERYHDKSFSEGEAEDAPVPKQVAKRQKIKARGVINTYCTKKEISAFNNPPTVFNMWGHPDILPLYKDSKKYLPPPPCPEYLSFLDATPIEDSPNFTSWLKAQQGELETAFFKLSVTKKMPTFSSNIRSLTTKVREHCEAELKNSIYCGGDNPEIFADEPIPGKLFPEYKAQIPTLMLVLKYRNLRFTSLNDKQFIIHLMTPASMDFPFELYIKAKAPFMHQALLLHWALYPTELMLNDALTHILNTCNPTVDMKAAKRYRKKILSDDKTLLKALAKDSFNTWCYAVNFVQSNVAEEFFNLCKPALPKHYEASFMPKTGRASIKY